MGDQKNLLLAIVASLAILLGFQFLFPSEEINLNKQGEENTDSIIPIPENSNIDISSREDIISESSRINIGNDLIEGTLALTGGRIDDILLKNYFETLEDDSQNIKLFSPKGSVNPYFAEYGWVSNSSKNIKLPDNNSIWIADKNSLSANQSVTLTWNNNEGIIFKRKISLDDEYMFTIEQTVINTTQNDIILYPYGLISRAGIPELSGLYILHEGPIGVFNDLLEELDYDDLEDEKITFKDNSDGWIGITDKYWLAALIPQNKTKFTGYFESFPTNTNTNFQATYTGPRIEVFGNSEVKYTSKLFTGAKEVSILNKHKDTGIKMFDRAVDFGWFYPITKPLFSLLDFFSKTFGNVGLAIIALTICIRIILFPLANKSFKSMSKMKILQPKMMEIRER